MAVEQCNYSGAETLARQQKKSREQAERRNRKHDFPVEAVLLLEEEAYA